ncbi:hypothetical protein CKO23_11145 [Thiocystis violacea]|nr:hypothetical protein [Thiocystis violacea]
MTEPLLLTLDHAAKRLSVSPRTVRRLIDARELLPVRIGRSLRVTADSVQAYVDRYIPVGNNSGCVGPDVQEASTCRENASRTRMASTVVPIRRSGGRPTSTQAESALDALLERPSGRKPKRSSRNGSSKRTASANGASNRRTPSMS